MEIGTQSFDQVVHLYPNIAGGYMLMSNIYADAYLWKGIYSMQQHRNSLYAWRKPGMAWIEVDKKVHEFIVGGKAFPETSTLVSKLDRLGMQIKGQGYVPQLHLVVEPKLDGTGELLY